MLEGLAAIDWTDLRHAYGNAGDVPALLHALASDESTVRDEALSGLFSNILHQGTVYSATAAAVPFLYELLSASSVSSKSDVAFLIACIASARAEDSTMHAVRSAVSRGLPELLVYLRSGDPEVRAAIAAALGEYPEHESRTLPHLCQLAEAEREPEVSHALLASIARLATR